MNYSKLYSTLISYRINNPLIKSKDLYVETHHIIPRCLGGGDSKENLINLTAREHFIAHRFLSKIYPEIIDLRFVVLMMVRRKSDKYSNISTSRYYEKLKTEHSNFVSLQMKGRVVSEVTRRRLSESMTGMFVGSDNPFFGKTHSEESRKIISDKMITRINEKGALRTGIKHTEYSKAKMLENCLRGDLHPMRTKPELAKAHSEAMKGIPKSQEHIDKISKANKGKVKSSSHRIALSRNLYTLVAPSGKEIIIEHSLFEFCKKENISFKMIENSYLKGGVVCKESRFQKSDKSKNTVGWTCIRKKK